MWDHDREDSVRGFPPNGTSRDRRPALGAHRNRSLGLAADDAARCSVIGCRRGDHRRAQHSTWDGCRGIGRIGGRFHPETVSSLSPKSSDHLSRPETIRTGYGAVSARGSSHLDPEVADNVEATACAAAWRSVTPALTGIFPTSAGTADRPQSFGRLQQLSSGLAC